MANSLIEDVMNDQPIKDGGNQSNEPKKKKSKKGIIIVLILILIIIICAGVAIWWLSNQEKSINVKQAFFESLTKNNIEQVGSVDLYEEFFGRLITENNSITTNIDFSYSTEDLSVSNIALAIDTENDLENLKTYSNMTLSYSDNDIFNLEFLADSEAFALKSDEVVSNFVGARYAYLLGLEDVSNDTTNNSSNTVDDNSTSNDVTTDIESEMSAIEDLTFSEDSIQIYTDILNRNLEDSQFTSNEVTLEMSSGTVDCTEYTLTMTEKQFIDICKQLLEGFETDANTIEVFTAILSVYGYSDSDLIDIVDDMISQLESYESDPDSSIVIKVYDNNGQTVKLSMQYSGITMEIEYLYGESESSIKLTAVEDETENGLSYEFINRKSNLTQNFDIEFSVIEESLVSQTVTIETEVVKSGSAYTLNIGFHYRDTQNTVTIDSMSDVEFTDVDVEDLTTDNCLFLDDLSEEEQENTLNQISERLQVVLSEKMSELSFIDTNTNTTLIDQAENNGDDTTDEKETAKQDLITAIQDEMTNSINNGEEYTLQDLEGLEVEGHTVTVEISDNLAVVTVDGYTFNIDSEFNLTEQ